VLSDYPNHTNNGWDVTFVSSLYAQVQVYAVCFQNTGKAPALLTARSVMYPSHAVPLASSWQINGSTSTSAPCPPNFTAAGGGYQMVGANGGLAHAAIQTSSPAGGSPASGWQVTGWNTDTLGATLTAYAICVDATLTTAVQQLATAYPVVAPGKFGNASMSPTCLNGSATLIASSGVDGLHVPTGAYSLAAWNWPHLGEVALTYDAPTSPTAWRQDFTIDATVPPPLTAPSTDTFITCIHPT
jgi:hypothetical protein